MKKKIKEAKLSIIVPAYNVEKDLSRCLLSLVEQTLKEVEIIVVNDGSTDNTQKVINQFVEKYPDKIKGFYKKNGGVSETRNFGVEKATSKYIGFVDSDDYVDCTMFEKLYKKIKFEKSDIVVCDFFRDKGTKLTKANKLKKCEIYNNSVKNEPEILLSSSVYLWNKLFKKDLFIKNNIYFPIGKCFEDSAVVYKMLFLSNKVSCVNEELYYYQVNRDESITNKVNKKMLDIIFSCEDIVEFFSKQENLNPKINEIVEYLCLHHLLVRLEKFLKSNNNILTAEFVGKMYHFLEKNFPYWRNNKYFKEKQRKSSNKRFYFLVKNKKALLLYLKISKKIRKSIRITINKIIGRKKKEKGSPLSKKRLRELQMIELDILLKVDEICKKHDITYYLGEGTLLGAARHNGFIPWDDDLDIVMFRDEYNKFLKIAIEELPPELHILNNKTYKKYHLPLTKIVTKNAKGFINVLDNNISDYKGPYIDIFPIDLLPLELSSKHFKVFKKIRFYRYLLLFKVNYKSVNTFKKFRYRIISKILSFNFLHKKIHDLSTLYSKEDSFFAANLASSYQPKRQIVPKKVFGNPKYLSFEGKKMPVPSDYKQLLETIYGDYTKLPPLNKRLPKHSFYDETSENKI